MLLRCESLEPPMSQLGQTVGLCVMSAQCRGLPFERISYGCLKITNNRYRRSFTSVGRAPAIRANGQYGT